MGYGLVRDVKLVPEVGNMDLVVWEKIRFETTSILPPIDDYRSLVPGK